MNHSLKLRIPRRFWLLEVTLNCFFATQTPVEMAIAAALTLHPSNIPLLALRALYTERPRSLRDVFAGSFLGPKFENHRVKCWMLVFVRRCTAHTAMGGGGTCRHRWMNFGSCLASS